MKIQPLVRFMLVGLAAAFLGCGEPGPDVNYVEGVVSLDGQPIEGVTVSFSSASDSGKSAVGTTDASGKFKLTTMPDGNTDGGAPEGEYFVGFVKSTVSVPGAATSTDDPNYGKEVPANTESAPTIVHEVPVTYNNPEKSGFKVTVKSGNNTGDDFKFDLKKQ